MARWRAALAVAVCLTIAACTGPAEPRGPSGTVQDSAPPGAVSLPTSSTVATPDVSVVPATIDKPYLDAVLAALDRIDGEATRLIKASNRLSPEALNLLAAIYNEAAFSIESQVWLRTLTDSPGLPGIVDNPGPRRTTVDRILVNTPSCVWMVTARDLSAVNSDPRPDEPVYVSLRAWGLRWCLREQTSRTVGRRRASWRSRRTAPAPV